MPNIFDGLNLMADDDIRLQIALFESINMGGAMQETGHRAVSKIVEFANMFVGGNKIEYEVKGIEGIVRDKMIHYKTLSRYELDERLKQLISERVLIGEQDDKAILSNDFLSIRVVREAAKIYSLSEYQSPANLADEIAEQYYTQFLTRLHKSLIKEEKAQAKITDTNLQLCLNKVPIEQKREMNKCIVLKEFSGRGIGKVIREEKGIRNLKNVVEYMGIESFDVLNTVIFTIYEKILGFNRLSRALLAQLVWVAVKAYGSRFSISSDLLPSFIRGEMSDRQMEEERTYRLMLAQRGELKDSVDNYREFIEGCKNKLMDYQLKLLEENSAYTSAKEKFHGLEIQKDQNHENSYYKDVIVSKKAVDDADAALKARTMMISELKMKQSNAQTMLEQSEAQLKTVLIKTEQITQEKSRNLSRQWIAYYYKFKFEDNIYNYIIENFTNSEVLRLECYLKEMHDCMDIAAFAKERKEEMDCTICEVSNGKNVEILYEAKFIKVIRKR